MQKSSQRGAGFAAVFFTLALVLSACGGSGSDSSGSDGSSGSGDRIDTELDAIQVPADFATIQEAVDSAESGDLILVAEGTYNEAVDVTTDDITIRGVDRNKVILDGEFELENGIRILDTDGVVVENMTARNYLSNGFFWTGSDRYRGSYLTAYRNGDYGVYSFDAYHGQFDNSYGGGSPDAGFYIGECFECDAVIDNVVAENNGLGYSGTNSGGELYIVNSIFRNNRAGIVPNSGAYELCYPGRDTTIVGNIVHDNNSTEADAINIALTAQGNGILMAGYVGADVERNLVYNHDRWGIVGIFLPEEDPADVVPPEEDDDVPCSETRDQTLPDPEDLPGIIVWLPRNNTVIGNSISESGLADIAIVNEDLGNCFADNDFTSSQPANVEAVAPCDGEGNGEWDVDAPPFELLAEEAAAPPEDTYRNAPEPEDQETMPDALSTTAEKFEAPTKPDVDAITLPEMPEGS